MDDAVDAEEWEPLTGPTLYSTGEGKNRAIKWQWACYDQPVHVSSLIAALEARIAAAFRLGLLQLRGLAAAQLRVAYPVLETAAKEQAEKDGTFLLPPEDDTSWLVSGHPYLGLRCATQHEGGRSSSNMTAIGTIVRWLPAGDDPEEDPVLFHMAHADGDGEDLELDEVGPAVDRFARMTSEEVEAAVEKALAKSTFGTYENTKARRGNRAASYGGLSLEKLKSELIDLEESLRSGLKAAGAAWEAGGGSRSDRARWLSRLKRAVEVKDVARRR